MRIGIDTRLQNETGVGRYIRNLVRWLPVVAPRHEFISIHPSVPWHGIREQVEMPRIIARHNIDLLHVPYFNVPFFYRKPFVVTIHDMIIDQFPTGRASTLFPPLYWMKRWGYKMIMKNATSRARVIIVPTTAVCNELISLYPDVKPSSVNVIYEGADEFANTDEKKPTGILMPYYLYVGNAYPHKNLERLVLAAPNFLDVSRNEKLVFVGKHDVFYETLKQFVHENGCGSLVHFAGEVSHDELGRLYRHAQAVIIPSLSEGFGLPMVEAMRVGVPVISSAIPVLREVGCSVCTFNPHSVESMMNAFKRFRGLPKKTIRECIIAGQKKSEKFSWKTMAQKTVNIYERCLDL